MSNERATSCCRRSWCTTLSTCRTFINIHTMSVCFSCYFIYCSHDVVFVLIYGRYGIGQNVIFFCCGFFFLSSIFFPRRLFSAVADSMSTWCGLSANLGCRSETCCTRFAENTGRNNRQLECGPMPNVMAALPIIGGALCSTPQSLSDAHYSSAVQ